MIASLPVVCCKVHLGHLGHLGRFVTLETLQASHLGRLEAPGTLESVGTLGAHFGSPLGHLEHWGALGGEPALGTPDSLGELGHLGHLDHSGALEPSRHVRTPGRPGPAYPKRQVRGVAG